MDIRQSDGRTNARLLWIAEQLATEAKRATNALACTARAQYQHTEVARLHIAIDLLKDELLGYHSTAPLPAPTTAPHGTVLATREDAETPGATDALIKLSNEVYALLCYAGDDIREAIGHTNMAVLHQRLNEARRLLDPPVESQRCHANTDGDCSWSACPQNRDGEPAKNGRNCPLADWSEDRRW